MGAVIEARNKLDKEFVIISRIDAGANLGDEELIARAKGCAKLGVDIIQPQPPPGPAKYPEKDKEGLKKLYKAIGAPEVLIWGMGPAGFSARDCEDVGAKMWVPKNSPRSAVVQALWGVYQELYDTGDYTPHTTKETSEFTRKMRGSEFWRELEKNYVP
jgi:2-methylisocitrate lyase-like PEP mutase family enzyme